MQLHRKVDDLAIVVTAELPEELGRSAKSSECAPGNP
jgi:hypothetical protein